MKEDLLWEKVLKRISEDVNSLVYATWFMPTKLKKDNNKFIIYVPIELHKKHLSDHYYDVITNNLLKEIDEVVEVTFVLDKELQDDEDLYYIPKHGSL